MGGTEAAKTKFGVQDWTVLITWVDVVTQLLNMLNVPFSALPKTLTWFTSLLCLVMLLLWGLHTFIVRILLRQARVRNLLVRL